MQRKHKHTSHTHCHKCVVLSDKCHLLQEDTKLHNFVSCLNILLYIPVLYILQIHAFIMMYTIKSNATVMMADRLNVCFDVGKCIKSAVKKSVFLLQMCFVKQPQCQFRPV